MGKDLHEDSFENFIKKNLENFDENPTDIMWDRILPVIPPKPSASWKRYALPFALLISIGLVIVLGLKLKEYKENSERLTVQLKVFNESKKLNSSQSFETNSNSDKNENKSKALDSNTEALSLKLPFENLKRDHLLKINRENASVLGNTSNNGNTPNDGIEQNIEQTTVTNTVSMIEKTAFTPFRIDDFIPLNTEQNTTENKVSKPTLMEIKPLALLQLTPIFAEIFPIYKKENSNNTPDFNRSKKQSIALFFAPTVLTNHIRPPKMGHNPNVPMPNEHIRLGKSIGVKWNTSLNSKWSLTVGSTYVNSLYDFKTKHYFSYEKGTEQSLGTDKVSNTAEYTGSSTYGEYSVGLDLTRSTNSAINQGESVDVELDATVNVNFITLPIYLNYNLLEINRLSLDIKGGLSFNKIIRNNMVVNDFRINREGIDLENFELKTKPKPTQNENYNYISGLAINYNIVENWSICIEPTWAASLSDNHRGLLGKTKAGTFSLEVGAKYGF